jgi:hypothetical protein
MKRLHPSSSGSFSATPAVRLASSKEDQAWFDDQLDSFHGLGATTPIGDFLRQIVEIDSKPVALQPGVPPVMRSRIAIVGSVGVLLSGSPASNLLSRTVDS